LALGLEEKSCDLKTVGVSYNDPYAVPHPFFSPLKSNVRCCPPKLKKRIILTTFVSGKY